MHYKALLGIQWNMVNDDIQLQQNNTKMIITFNNINNYNKKILFNKYVSFYLPVTIFYKLIYLSFDLSQAN